MVEKRVKSTGFSHRQLFSLNNHIKFELNEELRHTRQIKTLLYRHIYFLVYSHDVLVIMYYVFYLILLIFSKK